MASSGFILRAYQVDGTLVKEQVFVRLPIRIGRNALNDFELPSSTVSSFHARLTEEGGRFWVYDLNSTNGVFTRGPNEMESNQVDPARCAEVLPAHTQVVIGHQFWLRLDPTQESISERGNQKAGQVLGNWDAVSGMNGVSPLPPLGADGPQSLPPLPGLSGAVPIEARPVEPMPNNLRGWVPPQDRGNPALQTGYFNGLDLSVEQLALAGLRELSESLAPGNSLASSGDMARFITRVHDAIDVFCRSFIPLREGYSQFVSSMDLQRAKMQRSMHRSVGYIAVESARTPEQVAAALLNSNDKSIDSHKAIEGIFADLMIHQVALLDGVMRGVRALLEELAPEKIEQLASEGTNVLGFGRKKELWRAYCERYAELSDEDQAFAHIFGNEFADAYREYQRRRTSGEGR